MSKGTKKSIKSKLIQSQLFVASLVLLVCATGFLLNDAFIFKRSIERSLKSTASMLGSNLMPTLTFSDKSEATKILSSLQPESSITAALLLDGKGEKFAQYRSFHSEPMSANLGVATQSSVVQDHYLVFRYKFDQGADVQGVLIIEADLMAFAAEYRSYVWIFSVVLIAGFALSVMLAHLMHGSLSRPINTLAQTARRVSVSADYSLRMRDDDDVEKIEEVAILSSEFNQMLDQIQAKDHKIRLEKDAAERANHSKSLFLANMSHELRTPMHGILSFARFGQQKIDTASKEKLKSYFDEIHDSGSRLMSLLNDLLDLSKLEAGKISYSMRKADLIDTLKSVKIEMSAFAEERGLRLELKSEQEEVLGTFDPERIMQVARNIISNAIKFSSKGTAVEIFVESTPEIVKCSISNMGVGVPEDELETIFDKFVQSSKTRSEAGGTGLGLAICKEIVEQHGGRIWAESKPTGETRFTFELKSVSDGNIGQVA